MKTTDRVLQIVTGLQWDDHGAEVWHPAFGKGFIRVIDLGLSAKSTAEVFFRDGYRRLTRDCKIEFLPSDNMLDPYIYMGVPAGEEAQHER